MPLAPLYAGAVTLRRWAFDAGWLRAKHAGVRTVSVGGLEAGGTGKTPVVELVLRALVAGGRAPGLLTRGYGRETTELVVRPRGAPALPEQLGDEPAMLVARGVDVPVAACASRVTGAEALVRAGGVDTLVLDDGFAHRWLARDVDIVVLRAGVPLRGLHWLPWGSLRESAPSLSRASLVWLHARPELGGTVDPMRALDGLRVEAPVVVSRTRYGVVSDLAGAPRSLAGARVVGVAGIARPESFRAALEQQGAHVAAFVGYPDHYRYDGMVASVLEQVRRVARADAVVVTEKDAVKLRGFWGDRETLWTQALEVEITSGDAALAEVLEIDRKDLFAQRLAPGADNSR